jgi:hypothetical protein
MEMAASMDKIHGQLKVLEKELLLTRRGMLLGSLGAAVADGTLCKSSDKADVYLIEDGKKRPITGEAFTARKYSWSNVKTYSPDIINSIPTGATITDGSTSSSGGSGASSGGWTSFTPSAFPGTVNLDKARSAAKPIATFTKTMGVLNKGITLPSPISIKASGLQFAWSPLKGFPSIQIPEVAALQKTISDQSAKVNNQISATTSVINDMLSDKFESIPDWSLGNGPDIVKKVVGNFNKANKIFGKAQNALTQGATATKYTVDAAATITYATSQVLSVMPGRIKEITDAIAGVVNDNAQTLVNDIGNASTSQAKALADQISNGVSTYMSQLSKNMQTFYTDLTVALASDIQGVVTQVNNYVGDMSVAIQSDMGSMSKWFNSNLGDLNYNIQTNAKSLGDRISKDTQDKIAQFQTSIDKAKTEMTNAINDKVTFVQNQVNASLDSAKKDMAKITADTKTELNSSFQATKAEMDKRVGEVTATVNDIKKKIDATAANVEAQSKAVESATADIRKIGDQVSSQSSEIKNVGSQVASQARQVSSDAEEILKIKDTMKSLQSRLDDLAGKQASTETKPKSPFSFFGRNRAIPFLGTLSGDNLSDFLGQTAVLLAKKGSLSNVALSGDLGVN